MGSGITSSGTTEKWPKLFLVYVMDFTREYPAVNVRIVSAHKEEYVDAQDFAERWFADPAVMRIYELRQCYAIGKFRGQ